MSVLNGGKFGHGFVSAGVTQALSGKIGQIKTLPGRIVASAVVGGSISAATGGKFANGAVTAAFSRAFNDEASGAGRTRAYGDRAKHALSAIANTEEGAGILRDIDSNDEIVSVSIIENPDLNGPGQTKVTDLTRRGFWDFLTGARPNFRYAIEIELNPDYAQRHFYDADGQLFLPDSIRILAHELGHAHAFARQGFVGFYTNQVHAVSVENSIYRAINPSAPIRHPSMGHGRDYGN